MNRALLMMGGNLGDREKTMSEALNRLEKQAGKIIKAGAIYKTAPWGSDSNHYFLNRVVEIETNLEPGQLLAVLLGIEKEMGRQRSGNLNEPRTIDLDILYFGGERIKTKDLEVPHPRMHLRRFVMQPLAEEWPLWVHPVFGKNSLEILETLEDKLPVEKLGNGI